MLKGALIQVLLGLRVVIVQIPVGAKVQVTYFLVPTHKSTPKFYTGTRMEKSRSRIGIVLRVVLARVLKRTLGSAHQLSPEGLLLVLSINILA